MIWTGREEKRWNFEESEEMVPGRFAVERLGGGDSYEAYLGWDERRHCFVVVKIARPHLVDDATTRAALQREAALLERLSHPSIVRSFGHDLDCSSPHLVLEHLDGPTLETAIERHGPLPLDRLVALALDLASAVAYLEAENTVHLDIKPRNVLMSSPPRLIDLSIARSHDEAAATKAPIGTDAYMAPEQCDDERGTIGPPADVWGLGATLFHAAFGRAPFPRSQDRDRTAPRARWPQVAHDVEIPPRELPRSFVEVVVACLRRAPSDRPSGSEVVAALEPMIEALPESSVVRRRRSSAGAAKPPPGRSFGTATDVSRLAR